MRLAPIWGIIALGWGIIAVLALFRLHYPYRTIETDNFVVRLPQPWLQGSVYIVAILELCKRTAQARFILPYNLSAEVEIRPGWLPAFWFQPESRQIVLCFLFGPAIDRWIFLVYFAIAHEYGHLLSNTRTPIEDEAWANLFGLYTLHTVISHYQWPSWWESWLVHRDIWAGLVTLYGWQFLPGRRRKIAALFWKLWRIARRDCRNVFMAMDWKH